MKSKDVVIGMRVVPHSKSRNIHQRIIGLEGSAVWNRAKENNQPYLYVHGWDKDTQAWLLTDIPYSPEFSTGDYFLAKEFEPYVGEQ